MKVKQLILSLLFIFSIASSSLQASSHEAPVTVEGEKKEYQPKSIGELASSFWETTGINAILDTDDGEMTAEPAGSSAERLMTAFESSLGRIIMILIVFGLFYLAIAKDQEAGSKTVNIFFSGKLFFILSRVCFIAVG